MKKHLFYIAFAALAFSGCKNPYEKELAQLEAVRKTLSAADSVLAITNAAEAERLAKEVRNNLQLVQFNINKIGDTIDFKTALLLTEFRSLAKSLESVEKSHKRIGMAVDSAANNLGNLEHDLMNKSLAKEFTAEAAVAAERRQAEDLYGRAKNLPLQLSTIKAGYDTLAPAINNYLAELKRRLAEKTK